VLRFAKGESTQRSKLRAETLIERLRQEGVAQLAQVEADGLWLIADGSDLRKPHAAEMPALMKVRDLQGRMVPGYRTLNVIGSVPGRRTILYHRLFSSQEEGFVSEPVEVQTALSTVSEAVEPLKARMPATWLMDRGFDDVAVWRTIWAQDEHLVCRVKHVDRCVSYQDRDGVWQEGHLEEAQDQLVQLATMQAEMRLRRGRQKRAKMQRVKVQIWACPMRLSYDSHVRREGAGEILEQAIWLVQIRVPGSDMAPWMLVTDWPTDTAERAQTVFRMYAQRWSVEDAFKFTKQCLGWEDVQVLDLTAVRTLVAMAWVAAGFLFDLGVTLAKPELRLLARIGGWAERKDRPPGKITHTRGLQRLLDMLATSALLDDYVAEHGALPPAIAALLGADPST
jgi:hypothetical protein